MVGKVCFGLINHCGGLGVEELVQFVKIDVVVDCDQSSYSIKLFKIHNFK